MAGNWPPSGFHKSLEVGKAFQVLNETRVTAHMLKSVHLQIAILLITVICKWRQQQLLLPSNHSPVI